MKFSHNDKSKDTVPRPGSSGPNVNPMDYMQGENQRPEQHKQLIQILNTKKKQESNSEKSQHDTGIQKNTFLAFFVN